MTCFLVRRCPNAFTVSFKLETDEKLLIPKALGAIKKYGIHCVVANLLQTRYDTAVLVTGKPSKWSNARRRSLNVCKSPHRS